MATSTGQTSKKTREKKDTEPEWSARRVCITFTATDTMKWYQILSLRYYEHIDKENVNVLWKDVTTKDGHSNLESHFKISSRKSN